MSTQEPPAGTPRPWKRRLLIGVVVVAVGAVLVVVLGPSYRRSRAIQDLNSNDPTTRKSAEDYLKTGTDAATDDALLSEVLDDGNTFDLRRRCAALLKERSRVQLLEASFRSGDPGTRCVILAALFRESYFKRTYLADPDFRVPETVREWLARDGDPNRAFALQIAIAFEIEGIQPLLAPLLRRSESLGRNPKDVQQTLIAAGEAVLKSKDCADVPLVLALAESDPDELVRLRSLGTLEPLLLIPGPACPDAVPPDQLKSALFRILDTPGTSTLPRSLRMKTLMLLRRRPDWVAEARARVEAILAAGSNGAERRLALEDLIEAADPAFLATVARWFHDPDADVRSSAVLKAPGVAPPRLESCLIGILRDETLSGAAFDEALRGLQRSAKEWLGVPEEIRNVIKLEARELAVRQFSGEVFTRGESHGITRDALANTWFDWWAGSLQLSPEEITKAKEVRDVVRKAMDTGDVNAAEKALAAFERRVSGLFEYETGWVLSRKAP